MARTRVIIWGAMAALCLFTAITLWKWHQWRVMADAGASYAARVTCSCRYIEGRTPGSCAQDVAEDAGSVTITEDATARRITGSVPMLGRRSAVYKPGFGCLVEPR